jgi:hypothetical protein
MILEHATAKRYKTNLIYRGCDLLTLLSLTTKVARTVTTPGMLVGTT